MNLAWNQCSPESAWLWKCAGNVACQAEISYQRSKKTYRLYHIFTFGPFISVHILQTGGVCFYLSLRLLTVPCCDRLHRGCSPSIHFCPSLRTSPSPSAAPFWHHQPDFLPIRLSLRPFPRLCLPPLSLMSFRCDRSRVKLQVSALSVCAGSRSLPSSSQRCWKCKCGRSAHTCEHSTCGDAVTSRLLFVSLLCRLGSNSSTVAKVWERENFVGPERPLGESYLINGSLCRNIPDYFWQFSVDFSQKQNVFCLQWFSVLKTSINKTRRQTFFFRSLNLSDFDEESYTFFFFLTSWPVNL